MERELEVTRNSAGNLIQLLRVRKAGMQGARYSPSGTVIDPIAAEVLSPGEVIQKTYNNSSIPRR